MAAAPPVAWQAQAAAAVFAATFVLLALGRIGRRNVPRGAVSLGGGLLTMVLLGLSWSAVDAEVLLLLAGLMALAAMADQTGLFSPIVRLVDRPGRAALPSACLLVALASALLLNDAAVVVLVPLLLPVLVRRGIDGVAAVIWLAVSANVGSLLTPFGNPQNAVLARAGGLGVMEFASQQAAIFGVAALLVAVPAMRHAGRQTAVSRPATGASRRVRAASRRATAPSTQAHGASRRATGASTQAYGGSRQAIGRAAPAADDPAEAPGDSRRAAPPPSHHAWAPALGVLAFIGAAVAWPDRLGTAAALAAAGVFVLLRPLSSSRLDRRVARGVDVNVLALFVGLYLLTAGIGQWFPSQRLAPEDWGRWQATGIVLLVANAVGNVPAVLALQGLDPAWVAGRAPFLVSISTLGGSILLTGSAATLLAAEAARRHGVEVTFGAFARTAGPWMAAATALGAWWMW